MITETYFYVKPAEIDSMGIVHHSIYPIWFENGRYNLFKNADIPHNKMNSQGLFLPLLEMKCNYKSPAKYGNEILLRTSLIYISSVTVKFEYKVLNKINGMVLVTGKTVHAWTNKKLEPLNIKKTAPLIYSKLEQLIELPGKSSFIKRDN